MQTRHCTEIFIKTGYLNEYKTENNVKYFCFSRVLTANARHKCFQTKMLQQPQSQTATTAKIQSIENSMQISANMVDLETSYAFQTALANKQIN